MRESENRYQSASGQATPLKVLMPETVWQKMMGYINACSYEINGFGYVRQLDESTAQIEDVFILKQTVGPGSAVTEPNEVTQHITQMIEQGQDTSTLRFQWHSHVHMQAYFSGTDTGTIDTYANCDWMISLVANKREEFAIRLDMYQPFRLTVPTSLKVFSAMDDAIAQSCAREVQDKVSARIYRPPALRKRDPKSGLMGKRKKDRDAREALDNYPLPYVETDPETLVAAHYLAQSGAEARVNNRSMRSQKEGEDYGRTYQGGLW